MSARVFVVQHEEICPLGRIKGWLVEAGIEADVIRPYAGDMVPDRVEQDGLVVLGGTMGANDDDDVPWLAPTKRLLARAVHEGVPTFGVCLGHQLLAVACGGQVAVNPYGPTHGLRGVIPVGKDLASQSIPRSAAIHWNDDVITAVPPGAEVVARTPDGYPQVIKIGSSAWGVQFHPEADAGIVGVWADRTVAAGEITRAEADARLEEIALGDTALVEAGRSWCARLADLLVSRPGAARR